MFTVSQKLADYAVKSLGLDAALASDIEANRDAIVAHVEKAIDEGKVKYAEIKSLSADSGKTKGEELLSKAVSEAMAPMTKALGELASALAAQKPAPVAPESAPVASEGGAGAKAYAAYSQESDSKPKADDVKVRVKSIKESFDLTRRFVPNQTKSMSVPGMQAGQTREFAGVSQLEKAVAGATLKYLMTRSEIAGQGKCPAWAKMTDLDRQLMEYAAHEMEWSGPVGMRGSDDENADYGFAKGTRLSDIQIKAVLDSGTSGGLEAVPIVFDDLAILTPLLVGELLPLVDLRTTTRRRVEGFKVANPELYWTAEGTAPTEFSTNGFISEFNTNIHPCVGWMELGLDFEVDSPVAIADIIIGNYARRAAQKLDNAIATGSGSGEPLGLTNTPSAISVNSTNGASGPPVVTDYELLHFAIPKEYTQEAGNRKVFVGNQVSYQRARSIEVGTTDQRRVFGLDQNSYTMFDMPYKINHGIADEVQLCACLNRYVLYRRAGFDVRRVTEDADLAKKNLEMLVVRMRYGGQLNDGNALAVIEDGQSET
jgi:HK97 family phage major capsid protein